MNNSEQAASAFFGKQTRGPGRCFIPPTDLRPGNSASACVMFGENYERFPAQTAVCVVSVSKSDQLFIVEQIPDEK